MGFEHIIFEEWVLVLPCEVQSILTPKYPRYMFILLLGVKSHPARWEPESQYESRATLVLALTFTSTFQGMPAECSALQ